MSSLGYALSGFARGFNASLKNDPEERLRKDAQARLDFGETDLGRRDAANDIKIQAARDAARYEVETGRLKEGTISFFKDKREQEAVRTHLNTLNQAGIKRFDDEIVKDKDYTGLIELDPDVINLSTYSPLLQGGLKRLGESNFYYHSAQSRERKVAAANNEYTSFYHIIKEDFIKEQGLGYTLTPTDKNELQDAAYNALNINQQELFNQQSVNFHKAIVNTIKRHKSGAGAIIITDNTFRKALAKLYAKQRDDLKPTLRKTSEIKREIEALFSNHKKQQELGYGFSEVQYRTELREMFAKHIGELGLTSVDQIESLMTKFLENEINQVRLAKIMIRKYGVPKTDAGAGAESDAGTKNILEARVNTHLKEDSE